MPIQQRQNAIQRGKAVGRNALEYYPLQYAREKWDPVLLGFSEKLLGKNQQKQMPCYRYSVTVSKTLVSRRCPQEMWDWMPAVTEASLVN